MPVDDETFYNILGEPVNREILVTQMKNYYQQKLELGETHVTDFNEGSEIRNLLESVAVDLYSLMQDNYNVSQVCFVTTAYGEWLDLHGANPLIQLPRETGTEAMGLLTFSIPEPVASDTIIPESTVVANNEGLQFITDSEAVIVAGDTSVDVFGVCLTVGVDGNVPAGSITVVDDTNIDDTVSVINNDVFAGGVDYEDDDSYRERLLNFLNRDDFGSLPYYQSLVDNVDGVHDVKLVDAVGYTKKVLVNGDSKPVPDIVLSNVLLEYTDLNNIVVGHKFIVDSTGYTVLDLTIDLIVEVTIDEAKVNEVLNCFFNGGVTSDNYEYTGLSIDEVLNSVMLTSSLTELNNVVSVTVKNNDVVITDLTPDTNTVFKLGNVIINQTIVGE